MARYPLGQPVRLSATVADLSGTLTDAASLTLLVKSAAADGTWTTTGTYASPVKDATGTYHQDVPASDLLASGHYQYTWTPSDTTLVASPAFGDFDMFDPFEVRVLSRADAKDMLNIPQSDTTHDSELDEWIGSIESNIEGMTGGPLANRQITERVEATSGYTVLCVRQRPLVSLVSVVNVGSGLPLALTDMTDLDPNAGTIRRKLGWPFFGPFYQYLPIFSVTYVAGWGVSMPPAFSACARIIIRHLWDTQRGATPAPMMGGDETVVLPGWGYAIPNRAAELLRGQQDGIPFMSEAYL